VYGRAATRTVPWGSTMQDDPQETRRKVRPATSALTIDMVLSRAVAMSPFLAGAITSAFSGGRLLFVGMMLHTARRGSGYARWPPWNRREAEGPWYAATFTGIAEAAFAP